MSGTTVTRTYTWAMGHRLQHHDGLCRFPHGHTYSADVTVERYAVAASTPDSRGLQREGPGTGMVVDFHRLDALMQNKIGVLDHAFMVQKSDPFADVLDGFGVATGVHRVFVTEGPPTAENIAWILAGGLYVPLQSEHLRLVRLTVHEGPKSSATVEPR